MNQFFKFTLFYKKILVNLNSKILIDFQIKYEFIKMLPNFDAIDLIYRGTDNGFKFSDYEKKFFNK
jgi:hypothetical protein